jgi:hypothetical protein
MKFLIVLSLFFSFQFSSAQMIRCRGEIGFWLPTADKKWRAIEMKGRPFFEDYASNVGVLKIGKDSRSPAAMIYPFHGIEYKITNPDLKIETDRMSWFELTYQKKKLDCEIHQGTAE